MRLTILLAAALALAGCASTIPGVKISPEERVTCAAEGCSVWTESELHQLMTWAINKWREGQRGGL